MSKPKIRTIFKRKELIVHGQIIQKTCDTVLDEAYDRTLVIRFEVANVLLRKLLEEKK